MEPFTILCETCAARLKVTQPKAIGQKLACPKCNSMVQVVAPEGIDLPQTESGTEESGFDFDDIEKILQNAPQKSNSPNAKNRPNARVTRQVTTPRKTGDGAPIDTKPTEETNRAPAPGEQWTSATTQSRQKWLIAAAIGIGCTLLVITIIGAIISNSSNPTQTAAQLPPEKSVPQTDLPAENEHKENESPDTNDANKTEPTENPNNTKEAEQESQVPTAPDNADSSKSEKPQTTDLSKEKPTPTEEQPGQSTEEPSTADDTKTDKAPGQSRSNGFDSLLIGMNNNRDESVLNSNIGELSSLLEKKGTSILEINDLAAVIRNSQMLGLPNYHFSKPEPFQPEQLERLKDRCAGVQYENIPLLVTLREISLITGVPFQIDVDAISKEDIDLATPVNFKVVDKNFIELADEMLAPHQLTIDFSDSQIPRVTTIDAQKIIEARYELPKLADLSEEKIVQFTKSIKTFIAPQSWDNLQNEPLATPVPEEEQTGISTDGNQLLVRQTPRNQARIKDYLGKIQAGLQMKNGDLSGADVFKNRWSEAQQKTSQPFTSDFRSPVSLETMLNKIQQVSNVNIVVDWESVLPTGWTPQTTVPAKIKEKSVEDAVHQLARTMELTSRYIDSNTIEMTTFDTAANSKELEVYSCHEILSDNMTPEALMQAMQGALSFKTDQLNNIRVIYEPECECIIAFAPQLVQRQIQAVLDQLSRN